jgi:nucleoid-associated protein EbfC
MFGNMGQLGQIMQLLKDPEGLKQRFRDAQQRLEAARYHGESGGGQVRVTVDGKAEVIDLKLEPALVQAGDHELIEELTMAAVRDAVRQSREATQNEMQSLAGGLNLGGMFDMLGGGNRP